MNKHQLIKICKNKSKYLAAKKEIEAKALEFIKFINETIENYEYEKNK